MDDPNNQGLSGSDFIFALFLFALLASIFFIVQAVHNWRAYRKATAKKRAIAKDRRKNGWGGKF